ncbi:hypothetical protein DERF_001735 [Dermatophagoides farinae]|uniref:Uncharacterized protein n=1 Tax=Dermatophagoides farinae TaxID=6954 RepID=A0A922IEA4_DERFA|nr:hypothetical protein DERF_001735 [Dermatophagoides farinae]
MIVMVGWSVVALKRCRLIQTTTTTTKNEHDRKSIQQIAFFIYNMIKSLKLAFSPDCDDRNQSSILMGLAFVNYLND